MRFRGRKVVITGAVGGIGRVLVKLFALEGARVMFTDLSEEDCEDFARKLQRKDVKTLYYAGDLRSKIHCESLNEEAVKQMGGIDILLNNAGIIPRGTILETTDDMWYAALDINLTAAFTKNLGRDHAGDGIRVNAVCPHEVNTPMLRSGFVQRGLDPDTAIEALGKTVPLGHVADPAEIADVIAFLASDESRYVCGETIEVTGAKPVNG